jgi:hypothetical protein
MLPAAPTTMCARRSSEQCHITNNRFRTWIRPAFQEVEDGLRLTQCSFEAASPKFRPVIK